MAKQKQQDKQCPGCDMDSHDGLPVASMFRMGGHRPPICTACGNLELLHVERRGKKLTAPGKKGTQ